MKNTLTLTAVDVVIKITGSETVTQGEDILVSAVTVINRVNDFSEASVSLGYKTKKGLKKLQALFPQAGEGAHFGNLEITLKAGGPLSNITQDFCMFSGTIVGFSHVKASRQIAFSLNARGSLYQLSQILVGSPGFHPSTPQSLGLMALTVDAEDKSNPALQTASSIITQCMGMENAVDMYKCVVGGILKTWLAVGSGGGEFSQKAFAAAKRAYGLGEETKSVVETELDRILVSNGINNSSLFLAIKNSALLDMVMQAIGNAGLSFWDLLLGTLDTYGLDLISIGNSAVVVAKAPLENPIQFNTFLIEDETQISLDDFPFQAPTRCIVTAMQLGTDGSKGIPPHQNEVAIYPNSIEPTSQEAKTGVKTLFVSIPAFFNWAPHQVNDAYNDATQTVKHNGATHNPKEVKKEVEKAAEPGATEVDTLIKFWQDYAKYSLMKAKFKQRTGVVNLRLKPDVLPGFCARVRDPLGVATFDCAVQEVIHTISYAEARAETVIRVNYIRYRGELDPKPFENPFYPNFKPIQAAIQVLNAACGAA